jgi:hypothetical protein
MGRGLDRRDAVVDDREARPADHVPILARRQAVWNQAEQARATSAMLIARCLRAAAQNLAARGQAASAYADACTARQAAANRRQAATTGRDGAPGLDEFEVNGLIDGQPVGATWSRGRLVCDPALWDRAQLLVDLHEVFSDEAGRPCYVASLEGPDVAVALTLLRACDRVVGFSFAIPTPLAAGPDQASPAMP